MSEKRIYLTSEIRKLSNVNKRYIELEMVVSNTDPNLNGIVTTPEFLRKRYDTLVTMPLQVDKEKLEAGLVKSLTHQWDGENLNTQTIGTFVESFLEVDPEDEDNITMVGRSRVYKRYPKTVEAIEQLYKDGDLKFSWELLATDVKEIDGIGYIYDGEFEGHCIVSQPAYPDAVATQLVAEAFAKDIDNTQMGEAQESDIINNDVCELCEENEEGGKSIDMDKKLEEFLAEVLTEKSIDDVRAEIREAIIATVDSEQYGIYIYDMYPSQVIYEQYDRETWISEYFRVPYTISENSISVDTESKSEVVRVWMDKSDLESQENPMLSESEGRKVSEQDKLLSEKSEEVETLNTKLSELQEKIEELTSSEEPVEPIDEPADNTEPTEEPTEPIVSEEGTDETNEVDVDLAKKVIELSEAVEKLQSENEVLKPYRDKVIAEEAEKQRLAEEAETNRLTEMVSKYISEVDEEGNKVIPEDVQTFISERDEDKILIWIGKTITSGNHIITSEVNDVEDEYQPIIVGTSSDEQLVEKQDEEMEMY